MTAEFFHANRQTHMTKLTVAFHNTADVPKNGPTIRTDYTVPLFCTVRVKWTLVQAMKLCTGRTVHRGSRGITLLFLDHGTRWGEVSASRPDRSLPQGNTRYPLYRRLGGHQGRSGQVRKISPTPGFDLRTVQHVASRYTDYATRPATVL